MISTPNVTKRLEQIAYDLKIQPWNYADAHRRLIVETIARLPRRVQARVCTDGPVFLLVSDRPWSASTEFWPSPREPYILLNFGGVKVTGRNRRKLQQAIAHEIAHFILKHWRLYTPEGILEGKLKSGQRIEVAADNLCEKWGFGRAYTERQLAAHQKTMGG